MAWIYLIVAALFEIAWTFSIKYLEMKKVTSIKWLHFFNNTEGIYTLIPLLGYIVFGLANIYCFSVALKTIPTATALAVWMGISLVGIKIVDISILKQPYNYTQFIFISLILIGIIGLKAGK
jgi:quaternary ammonium compound-resistance protein SugE